MIATWQLKTVDNGLEVVYRNLQTTEQMSCGIIDLEPSKLLSWMIDEGSGGSEVIFLNNQMYGFLMPAVGDSYIPTFEDFLYNHVLGDSK